MDLKRSLFGSRPYIKLSLAESMLTSQPRKVAIEGIPALVHACIERAQLCRAYMDRDDDRTRIPTTEGPSSGAHCLRAANERLLAQMAVEAAFIYWFALPESQNGNLGFLEQETTRLNS